MNTLQIGTAGVVKAVTETFFQGNFLGLIYRRWAT